MANTVVAIFTVKLFFFVTVAAHQLIHGLALDALRPAGAEFGFTFLHGFMPTFYVDVTDIFMGSRGARIVTAVSGPLVHLVLGALYPVAASAARAASSRRFRPPPG